MRTFKVIALLPFIAASIYCYFKVAAPDQQEFIKEKATQIINKSIELYEDKGKYMDIAVDMGQKVSNTFKTMSGEV